VSTVRLDIPPLAGGLGVDLAAIARAGADASLNVSRMSFRNSRTPTGEPWPTLAASTIRQRRNLSDKPLIDTGLLLNSLMASEPFQTGDGGVSVDVGASGTSLEYAAIHNLGGMAGRNRAVRIPQRRYLIDPENMPYGFVDELHQITIGEIERRPESLWRRIVNGIGRLF